MGSTGGLDRVRTLVVDDDERWAQVTGQLLASRREAFTVETAATLSAGRELYETWEPDCVVCDYRLPDGTGVELLETVRAQEPDRPFLLVTARGDESVASEAIRQGVTDYVRKDHTDDTAAVLAERIAGAVRRYRTERALERERRSKEAALEILTGTTAVDETLERFCARLVADHEFTCVWIGRDEAEPVPAASAGCESYLDRLSEVGTDDAPAWRVATADEPVVVDCSAETKQVFTEETDHRSAETKQGPGGTTDHVSGEETGHRSTKADHVSGEEAKYESREKADDWRSLATAYGFDRAIAVPVGHDGVQFGTLTAYTDGEIGERARTIVTEYASAAGYALMTAERKRSLMAARPITIRVELATASVPLLAVAAALPARATIDVASAVPRDDGETVYVTHIAGVTAARLEARASQVEGVSSVRAEPDSTRCTIVVSAATPEEICAAHGTLVVETTLSEGTVTVEVNATDHTAVGTIREALTAEYGTVRASTVWRDEETPIPATNEELLEPLTDRQRSVLRHAFDVGYFDRPRETSATELADQFGVARATVTQHLRVAQQKLFGRLFED